LVSGVAGYLGGLIATWTYLPWDGPRYPIGNGINLAVSAGIIFVPLVFLVWMKYDNKKRDQLTIEERQQMLSGLTQAQTVDLDWKHPDFRWKP
jgi:hypothetical protein